MADTIKKQVIQESDYSKYLEDLKNYYTLKNKFISYKQTFKNKLINSTDSLEIKRKLFSKKLFKCVNCGKIGGTIFYENNKILRATCGNTTNPCNLNLEIIKMNPILINEELTDTNISLINKKKEIILTKLDFLFNYIQEDKAVELFEKLKSELETFQEKFNQLFTLYNSITNNTETQILIDEKINEHNSIVSDYKQFIKLYKDTDETAYLKDAVFLYTSKLKQLDELILTLKYKYNKLEFDEDDKFLFQYKYTLKDLELIKKPQ
tara:strand:- start:1184 stop:1978 length:795 start_codon:yes stop_codon:yes gene_type:complete